MADINLLANDAPAEQAHAVAPPTRTDDQIFRSSKWVPIGKSNCILDVQKSQRNPIFSIDVAILKNTNFFRAFTASSMIPGPAFEIIKVFHPDVIHLQYQMEECHKLLTNSVDDPILRNNVSKPLPTGWAIIFQDKYGVQIMMRFNKIYKFSDGTLQQIDEALDYREGRGSVQGIHVRYSEAFEDNADLRQPGELCCGRVRERDYRLLKRTE
nr:hypothetical protein [Tanacetum cinerariifolium]